MTSEAPGPRGKDVFIIGGGNSAGQAAINFPEWARTVTVVVRGAPHSRGCSQRATSATAPPSVSQPRSARAPWPSKLVHRLLAERH